MALHKKQKNALVDYHIPIKLNSPTDVLAASLGPRLLGADRGIKFFDAAVVGYAAAVVVQLVAHGVDAQRGLLVSHVVLEQMLGAAAVERLLRNLLMQAAQTVAGVPQVVDLHEKCLLNDVVHLLGALARLPVEEALLGDVQGDLQVEERLTALPL